MKSDVVDGENLSQEARLEGSVLDFKHSNESFFSQRDINIFFNSIPGGLILLDARGVVTKSNTQAQEFLNCPLEGKLWRDLVKHCFSSVMNDDMDLLAHSGKYLQVATHSFEGYGQVILLTDNTQTHALKHQLKRHKRLTDLGKMVSALAHQIRTPLSSALIYLSHLREQDLEGATRDRYMQKIHGRLIHMEKQVRDMLLFVRHELPLNDHESLHCLQQGVDEAIETVIKAHPGGCVWRIDGQGDVRCHRESLIGAIVNLVNNAIQASEPQEPIAIALEVIDAEAIASLSEKTERRFLPNIAASKEKQCGEIFLKYLCITVEDFGEGMNKSDLEKINHSFFTTKREGTGLGLTIVKAVAKAHGGFFDLYSKKNVGTQAKVYLPCFDKVLKKL